MTSQGSPKTQKTLQNGLQNGVWKRSKWHFHFFTFVQQIFTFFKKWSCALYTVNNESKPQFLLSRFNPKTTKKTSKKHSKMIPKTVKIESQMAHKQRLPKSSPQRA